MSQSVVDFTINLAADIGNSEFAAYINNELIRFPNVYSRPVNRGVKADIPLNTVINQLINEMDVTISSPAVKFNGLYFVGQKAINTSDKPKSINVGREQKYNTDYAIISMLSVISNYVVMKHYEKAKNLPKQLNIKVNKTVTALPINEWDVENAQYFKQRFINHLHSVTVHINNGLYNVPVTIEFDKKRFFVSAEGLPAIYAIISSENNDLFKDMKLFSPASKNLKNGKVTAEYFEGKRVAHIDIGDGTVDLPITHGLNLNRNVLVGTNHGAGHAIKKALSDFMKAKNLSKITRQKFSEYLKDENHEYHKDAWEFLKIPALNEAEFIYDAFENVLDEVDNEIDIVCVYGGGSIVLREYLEPLLTELCKNLQKDLIWIPKEYAPLMNVKGLKVMLDNIK
jgi:plasmid segregation protein ParM